MKKIKNKKALIILLVVIIALGAFGYTRLNGNQNQGDLDNQVTEVEYTVEKTSIKKSITGSGSIEPSDNRKVLSEIEGTIDDIYVEEGQEVNEDEIIAVYELESDTSEELDLETQKLNLLVAQKDLNELYQAQKDLNVFAEDAGIVEFYLEEGDEVSKSTKIGDITEINAIYFQSYFTETQINNFTIGDKAEVFINSALITLEGEITSIDRTPVSTGSNSIGYMVEGKINYKGKLEEGSEIKVTVVTDTNSFTSPYTGEVVENSPEDIYPSYSAEVESLEVSSGEYVEKGQLIAVLESEDLSIEIMEKEINVEENILELEDLTEEDSTVTSPIAGTILTVSVDEQGYVEKGTQLFQIADLENMEVIISVDELDILNISKGQEVVIESEAFEDEIFIGKVASISLNGNNSSGVTTYDVTISLEDRKELMSGMNVDVEILIEEKEDALVIPIEAVTKVGTKYIVSTKDEEGNSTPLEIEIGITTDNYVEVISGLSEGDSVYYTTEASEDFSGGFMIPGMGSGGGQNRPEGGEPGSGGSRQW